MLRTLQEIDRSASFAAAAERLNMTLSAVSMQMKTLEEELGVALFDRAFRPPKLTARGRAVCDHAGVVIAAEDALMRECLPDDGLRGRFRIGFVPTASARLLPGFLIRAGRDTPEARFDIETDLSEALEARVLSGQLDCAVVTASATPANGIRYHELRTEALVFAAPATCAGLPMDRLFRDLPFFHFMPHSGIGKLIADYVGDQPGRSIVLDSVEAIMECVGKGIGFTLLPEPDVARFSSERTCLLEPGAVRLTRSLVLATRKDRQDDLTLRRLHALFDG